MIIHYMWGMWDSKKIPDKYLKQHENNNTYFKNFKYRLHNKDDILKLVDIFNDEHDNTFKELFNNIKRKICQADLGRYLLIYYYGGIYLDNDIQIKKNIDIEELDNNNNGIWFVETEVDNIKNLGEREKPYKIRYANYIIANNNDKSEILLEIIKECINRIKILLKTNKKWSDRDVLWVTGPDVITTIIHETKLNNFITYDKNKSDSILKHSCNGTWVKNKDSKLFKIKI